MLINIDEVMMNSLAFALNMPVAAFFSDAVQHDVVQMILTAGPMVKFVLLVLLLFSVISWMIIYVKFRLFGKAARETETFMELFSEDTGLKGIYGAGKELTYSPIARLFVAGYSELMRIQKIQGAAKSQPGQINSRESLYLHSPKAIINNLERTLKKSTLDQLNRLERSTGFLATTGNTAPFIGLFGTVWGIMSSFRSLGLKGSASLAVVAPGISEALVATAFGLFAAIPAVVAYNYFTQKTSAVGAEMDIFTSDFLTMVERQFFKEDVAAKTRG